MIPPQAYSKRDIADAVKWVGTLPEDIGKDIRTASQAVWLYLRSQRGASIPSAEDVRISLATAAGASKSSIEFQKTLKDLQPQIQNFDFLNNNSSAPQVPKAQPSRNEEPEVKTAHTNGSAGPASFNLDPLETIEKPAQPRVSQSLSTQLDPRSQEIVDEIQLKLNLSSTTEVIRMCLALGHKSLKEKDLL